MNQFIQVIILFVLSWFVTGCSSLNSEVNPYLVHYSNQPVKLDGQLDDPAWNKAAPINFRLMSKHGPGKENGTAKILWDNNFIYVGAVFQDSDIVQESDADWRHYARSGDVLAIFMMPREMRYYWAVYGTPNNKKASFFFLSGGRKGLPSCFDYKVPAIVVAATMKGTLNNLRDYDMGWSVEIAIPKRELEKYGAKISPWEVWRFNLGRYNYSAYLDHREITTTCFYGAECLHDSGSWNFLKFTKP